MAYDFTADSDVQLTLSGELTNQATEFEGQINELYSEIDNLGGSWNGEDYKLFQEGTGGYKTALADLKEGIDLFAKHFERLSEGTISLATDLATIIENAVEGGAAGGSGGPGGAGDDQAAYRGQTKSDGSYNPYGGKTETETDASGNTIYKYYDEQGHLMQMDKWNKDGKLIRQETYDSNEKANYVMFTNTDGSRVEQESVDGNLVSYKKYDANDNLVKHIEYGYDENGENISRTTFSSNGTYFEENLSEGSVVGVKQYDENGNLLFENTSDAAAVAAALAGGAAYSLNPDGSYVITTENNNGTVDTKYNKDGYKESQSTINKNGITTKTELYDEDGNVTEKYEYDDNGDITCHLKRDENGDLVEVTDEGDGTDGDGTEGDENPPEGTDGDGTEGDENPPEGTDDSVTGGDDAAAGETGGHYYQEGNNYAINTTGKSSDTIYNEACDLASEMSVEMGYLSDYKLDLMNGKSILDTAHSSGKITDEDYQALAAEYDERIALCDDQIALRADVCNSLNTATSDNWGTNDGALKDARDFGANDVVASQETIAQINKQMEPLIEVSEISKEIRADGSTNNAASLHARYLSYLNGTQANRIASLQNNYDHPSELTLKSAYAAAIHSGEYLESQSIDGAIFFNTYDYMHNNVGDNYIVTMGDPSYAKSDMSKLDGQARYQGYDSVYYNGMFYTYGEWSVLNGSMSTN